MGSFFSRFPLTITVVLAPVWLGCADGPATSEAGAVRSAGASPGPAVPATAAPAVVALGSAAPRTSAASAAASAKTPASVAEEVLAAMDPTTAACEDLYQYACGGWLEANPVPADRARYTRSFSVLRERNMALLRNVLEGLATPDATDVEGTQLGQLYATCMDEAAIDRAGAAPLAVALAAVDALEAGAGLMPLLGSLHARGVDVLFRVRVGPDDKDPGTNVLQLAQSGLGLPDRSYYTEPGRNEIREAYRTHMATNFALLGETARQAAASATAVVQFETQLAKLQLTRVQRRDPDATYHKLELATLREGGGLDWAAYFAALGVGAPERLLVESPQYLQQAAGLLASTKPAVLRAYLRWSVTRAVAQALGTGFSGAEFEFFKRTLRGQQQVEPRWKRCVGMVGEAMPHALGRYYVARAFAPQSKALASDLIVRTEAAFEANLPSLAWMDKGTRARAVAKMKAVRNKVGYPEQPRQYAGLSIHPGQLVQSLAAADRFNVAYNLAKAGKPVDPTLWRGSPQTVNASYASTRNLMWFPAGILQAPFFDPSFPMAMNFGGIGMVAGHELTHGFDDSGRKYDGSGMLRPWWDDAAVEKFEDRLTCVGDAYAGPEVLPGLHVDPKLTMGENIADLGGLAQAFAAYRTWARDHEGDNKPHVPGLTNEQLVFVAYAQVWCTNITDQALQVAVATDPHSPARLRVNVPAAHTPEFAEVFGCTEGQPMAPKDRCEVW